MAKSRSGFKYRGGDRTVEEVVRKSKQSGGGFDSYVKQDIPFYKPKEGECAVRIMPASWEPDLKMDNGESWGDSWEIGIWLHYKVGPDEGAYLCLDKMKGEHCPICAARADAEADEADDLKPSWRALVWVVDRDNEKAGPMVWSMPRTLFTEIWGRSVDKKHNTPILIDDPDDGFDVLFNRAGTGITTKYTSVEIERDPSPLNDDIDKQEDWLDYITEHPLPAVLNFYEPEHMEKLLYGRSGGSRDKDKDDDDRSSRRSRSRDKDDDDDRSSRRSRRSDPDEVEEGAPRSRRRADKDDDDGDRSSRRSRRSRDKDEDDDKDEDRSSRRRSRDKDEDDDERPSRRSRRDKDEDKDEEDERPSRRRSRDKDADEDKDDEDERPSRSRSRERYRPSEDAIKDDDDGGKKDDEDDPSDKAKSSLERMRSRRRSRD